jgi:hypothetical protein
MRDVNGNTGNINRGNNNTNDDDDDKGFGDAMGPLNNNHLRIGFQNIGGLSCNNTEQDKLIQQFIRSNPFDVCGISEVNLCWPALQEELQFGERMSRRFNPRENRKNYAYNIHQTTRRRNSVTQYGGTAMISQKNAAIRHYRSHKDQRGLGRWIEQTFKGKGTHFLEDGWNRHSKAKEHISSQSFADFADTAQTDRRQPNLIQSLGSTVTNLTSSG